MVEVIDTNGYLPVPGGFYPGDLAAQHFVETKFEDSQGFAERTRSMALDMMRNLSNEQFTGLDRADREFDFQLKTPEMPDLVVPDPPSNLKIPQFSGEIPKIGNLEPPDATEMLVDTNVPGDVLESLKNEFFEGFKVPEGYSPEVEQGIYDRARSRREADLRHKKDAAYNEFAKRGFSGPPGALQELLQRYDIEDHREETDLNRDIIKQQADLVRQKYEFLMQLGQNLNTHLLERARFQAGTAMEKARLQLQFALDVFSSKLRKAEIQSTLLQAEVQIYAEQARMESLKFDAYRSQIQGVQTKAELERIKTQIFSEVRQATSETHRLQLEQDRMNIESAIRKQEHQRSIAESSANIAAQLAASAMTAVSTSAQISGTQSEQRSRSYQAGITRNDGVYYQYTGSAE